MIGHRKWGQEESGERAKERQKDRERERDKEGGKSDENKQRERENALLLIVIHAQRWPENKAMRWVSSAVGDEPHSPYTPPPPPCPTPTHLPSATQPSHPMALGGSLGRLQRPWHIYVYITPALALRAHFFWASPSSASSPPLTFQFSVPDCCVFGEIPAQGGNFPREGAGREKIRPQQSQGDMGRQIKGHHPWNTGY